MNIIVINLTRFGDQLQSQAALSALAAPGTADGEPNRVGLICLSNFVGGAALLRHVSLIRPLPGDGFLGNLERDWVEAEAALWQWREAIRREFPPDLVCNLTPSTAGRLLGRFLAEGVPLCGFGLNELGFGAASSWAVFFQGSSRRREACPFNLVDLFRAVAGKTSGQEGDSLLALPKNVRQEKELAEDLEAVRRSSGAKGLVAFQLGASEERRRWPEEYFARLGQGLWENLRLLPLLLGSAEESPLARRYKHLTSSPCLDLTGKTRLEDLALVVKETRLLVSNDTGTMHLAAGLGTPVLGLFLATAQAWDTGPYQPGSCSLEPGLDCHPCAFAVECPHDLRCRWAIPPDEALRLCLAFLEHGQWPHSGAAAVFRPEEAARYAFDPVRDRPRVWLAHRDVFGFLDLQSLSGHEESSRTVWFREQRHFLRQFLDRDPQKPFYYADTAGKCLLSPPERETFAAELAALQAQLDLLAELGRMLIQKPLPRLQEGFLQAMRRSTSVFESSSCLAALSLLWQMEIQERGESLETALQCIDQYRSLISSLLQRVRALLERSF